MPVLNGLAALRALKISSQVSILTRFERLDSSTLEPWIDVPRRIAKGRGSYFTHLEGFQLSSREDGRIKDLISFTRHRDHHDAVVEANVESEFWDELLPRRMFRRSLDVYHQALAR